MNIASVPWRCGQSCTLRAARQAQIAGGDPADDRRGVEGVEAGMPRERRVDDAARLVDVRRARDVGEDAAGAQGRDRGIQQRGLQSRQLGDVTRLLAPSGLRPASQRAEARCRARRAGCGRTRRESRSRTAWPSPSSTSGAGSKTASALRTSRARVGTSSFATSTAPPAAASAASRAALPPGPAHRSSQRSPATIGRARLRARAASCEPSSCTRARPLATTGFADGSPPADRAPDRRDATRLADLGDGGEAGQRDKADRGRLVVGGEQLLELALAPLERQGGAEGGDDPVRVRVLDGQPLVAAEPGQRPFTPFLGRRPRDRAQHPVREPLGRPLAGRRDERDRLVDGGVRGDPHRQQLMDAEPERIEHLRVEPLQRAIDRRGRARGRSSRASAVCRRRARWRGRRRRARAAPRRAATAAAGSRRRRPPAPRAAPRRRPGERAAPGRGALGGRGRRRHRATTVEPSRPRHQSAAGIARLPAGCTSTSSSGTEPVPTYTPPAALLDATGLQRGARRGRWTPHAP